MIRPLYSGMEQPTVTTALVCTTMSDPAAELQDFEQVVQSWPTPAQRCGDRGCPAVAVQAHHAEWPTDRCRHNRLREFFVSVEPRRVI